MPDGPATSPPSGTDADSPPVDELAKGLPGLPIESGKARIDESGFHGRARRRRREVHIAWADVVRIAQTDEWFCVVGPPAGGRRRRKTAYIRMKKRERKKAEAAWREYVCRTMARDGVLKGGLFDDGRAWDYAGTFFVIGGVACLSAWAGWQFLYRPLPPGAREAHAYFAVVMVVLLLSGLLGILQGVRKFHDTRTDKKLWSRWEVRPDGLTYWPDDTERRLAIEPGDLVTGGNAVVSGVRVPLWHFSRNPMATELVLALGERAGAHVRPVPMVRFTVTLAVAAIMLAVFAWMRFQGWCFVGLLVVSLWAAAVGPLMIFLTRRYHRLLLQDGRAMLERLGW